MLDEPSSTAEQPLQYVYSSAFPDLLENINATLLVSTYQAGKVIAVRAVNGRLSMLLRSFDKAMGLAINSRWMAVGSRSQIWFLQNAPDIAPQIEPPGQHDACYLPRRSHVTGDILCHEIDWAGNTLWIVNTRFSCLATLEPDYCFVPRWLPPFVSAIVPEDRCHLNGLAIVDDEPRYVTALGQTNSFNGWRDGKSSGACVLDVKESNVVASGLSMAHSPRWHAGRLWLLESGLGLLATIDLASGRKHVIAEFPGFTRGLAIFGRYAFVGLSKIRESAAFGGLPFANKLDDLKCGVWVLDLQSGQTVAFLEFAAGVTELFDVKVLPGVRFPAIVGMQKDTIQGAFVFPPRINMAHGSAPKASSQETSGTQLEKKAGQGASAKSGER